MEFENIINHEKDKLEINGFIESGKQFDLDIKIPEDDRNVIFGTIKDHYGNPICDAVVKLIEIKKCIDGKERLPVSHTFTNNFGQFVFGPLCPNKQYAIDIWVNRVEHVKICEVCKHKEKCLHGIELECDNFCKDEYEECLCENKSE